VLVNWLFCLKNIKIMQEGNNGKANSAMVEYWNIGMMGKL
jgi:hypothetical protein